MPWVRKQDLLNENKFFTEPTSHFLGGGGRRQISTNYLQLHNAAKANVELPFTLASADLEF